MRLMRCHTVRFASSITLLVRIVDYVKNVMSVNKEEKMASDAIVLWGLLLLYGIPICAIAYWLEKMITKGEDNE